VQLDLHTGPTGRVFICLSHAAQLAAALNEIIDKEWERVEKENYRPKKRPRGKAPPDEQTRGWVNLIRRGSR
jgi:hypothetical protein